MQGYVNKHSGDTISIHHGNYRAAKSQSILVKPSCYCETEELKIAKIWIMKFVSQFSGINLIASWLGVADIGIFTTMRALRGLRPLRALSRIQGMKVSRPRLCARTPLDSMVAGKKVMLKK